ncbi:MAG: RsmE family RNA methyltransferase, partial [Bacteroidota bacterium]
MQIFLLERIESSSGWLDPTETRHCIKVLRHKVGDEIWCIDGQGTAYQAVITAYDKEHTSLQLRQSYPGWGEHDRHIRLLVSPLRLRDRFEFMIEKAVELGVNEIVPISCQRTDKYQSKFKPSRIQTLIASRERLHCLLAVAMR